MTQINNILRIDASLGGEASVSKQLADAVQERLSEKGPVTLKHHDISLNMPHIDRSWTEANFTIAENRTAAQNEILERSDAYVAELQAADTLIVSTPIYNFGIPSHLKAWIDHIARARITFKYTENGPVGLLENKRAIITIASGGTKVSSEIDFASSYLKHVLGFVGIHDVTIIAADALSSEREAKIASAKDQIRAL